MLLNVQKYLHNHTLEDLEKNFGIVITRYDDRVVLNYSQIDSPKFHHICDECRGLILSYPGFEVLCRSFDRFYNYGEGNKNQRHEFEISSSISYTKIDGSLINIYNDGIQWNCATRKMAFAEGLTTKGNTFKSVVEKALDDTVNNVFENAVKDFTFICEVVSPETRVVVPYKEYDIYLLAVRNRCTGEYLDHTGLLMTADYFGLKIPDQYSFDSFDGIMKAVKELEPVAEDGEGYVCYDCDSQNRIKVKNPGYVALANLRMNGAISNKRIVKLVFDQDYEEYLLLFPEDKEFFDPYIKAYEKMINDINDYYNLYNDIQPQKKFALIIKDLPIAGILFSLRKGLTLEEIFDKMTDNKKEELLNRYKGK